MKYALHSIVDDKRRPESKIVSAGGDDSIPNEAY